MERAKLRVSVVIPVYNEEDMIGPCLDAILSQTVAADEIIVVDNGSTDATADRLRSYCGRVVSLREPRRGVHHARNTGMDAATGDLICRIDVDTRLPPGWIEQIHDLFADRTVGAVTGPARYYDIMLPGLIARLDLLLRAAWAQCHLACWGNAAMPVFALVRTGLASFMVAGASWRVPCWPGFLTG